MKKLGFKPLHSVLLSSISLVLLGLSATSAMADMCVKSDTYYRIGGSLSGNSIKPSSTGVENNLLQSGVDIWDWNGATNYGAVPSVASNQMLNIAGGQMTVVPLTGNCGQAPTPGPASQKPSPIKFVGLHPVTIQPDPNNPGNYQAQVVWAEWQAPFAAELQVIENGQVLATQSYELPDGTHPQMTITISNLTPGAHQLDFKLINAAGSTDNPKTINAGQPESADFHVNPCLQTTFSLSQFEPVYKVQNVCDTPVDVDPETHFVFNNDKSGALVKAYGTQAIGYSSNINDAYPSASGVIMGDPTKAANTPSNDQQQEFAYFQYDKASKSLDPLQSLSFYFYGFSKSHTAPNANLISVTTAYDKLDNPAIKSATVVNGQMPTGVSHKPAVNAYLTTVDVDNNIQDLYTFSMPWGDQRVIATAPLAQSGPYTIQPWDFEQNGQWYSADSQSVSDGQTVNVNYQAQAANSTIHVDTHSNYPLFGKHVLAYPTFIVSGGIGNKQVRDYPNGHPRYMLNNHFDLTGLLSNRQFTLKSSSGSFNIYPTESTAASSGDPGFHDCIATATPAVSKDGITVSTVDGSTSRISINYECSKHIADKIRVNVVTPSGYKGKPINVSFSDLSHTTAPLSTTTSQIYLRDGDQYSVSVPELEVNGTAYRVSVNPGIIVPGRDMTVTVSYTPVVPSFTPFDDITLGLGAYDQTHASSSTVNGSDNPAHMPANLKTITAAFITSDGGACQGTWGGYSDADDSATSGKLASQLKAFGDMQDHHLYISFGGESGTYVSQACQSPQALATEYERIYKAYLKHGVLGLDFDIEGSGQSDIASLQRQGQALHIFQQQYPAAEIWLTLPVMPTGLTQQGLDVIKYISGQGQGYEGAKITGVNVMAMDYGQENQEMGQDAISAAQSLATQLHAIYPDKDAAMINAMIGVTPMIGKNDNGNKPFTLADAKMLGQYAKQHGIARIAMWSLDRDDYNSKDTGTSPYSSSVPESDYGFSTNFLAGLSGQ